MCGLVGACGALTYQDKDILRMLLRFSAATRGDDSTGVAVVSKGKPEAVIYKTTGAPENLFDLSSYDKVSTYDKTMFIGHTRKATVGAVTRAAAHPYQFGNLTGVHNGTLKNWRQLPTPDLVTDSATLYAYMAEVGARTAIEAAEGAYALIWYDESDETLNFYRNNERSLFYAFSADYKKMFWASEPWMLHIALGRSPINMADLAPAGEDARYVEPFEADTWFRVKIGDGKNTITFLENEDLKGGVNKPVVVQPPFRSPYRSPFVWEADKKKRT